MGQSIATRTDIFAHFWCHRGPASEILCPLSTARPKPAIIWQSLCSPWSICPLSWLLQELGISPHALNRIKYELVTALCRREMKSVPTQRKSCRTFGYSGRSPTSTLQTPLLLIVGGCPAPYSIRQCRASSAPIHASKAETKPMLLTNRFICILTGAQILDTDFFCTTVQEPVQNMLFSLFMYKKTQNPTNEMTKSVAVFTHNWHSSTTNQITSTCPRPSCQLRGQHHLSLMAALSVNRCNSPSPLKDKHSPQANWGQQQTTYKSWTHQLPINASPPGNRRIWGNGKKKNQTKPKGTNQKCTKN